jgi:2-polyprenyl-6-methoxyphenol hydroxylase-like FAD-dependent oxidoreductase
MKAIDVAVVGGGPGGLALARALARSAPGVKVQVRGERRGAHGAARAARRGAARRGAARRGAARRGASRDPAHSVAAH